MGNNLWPRVHASRFGHFELPASSVSRTKSLWESCLAYSILTADLNLRLPL